MYSLKTFNLKYVCTSYLPLLSALLNCRFFAGTRFGFWLNCFPYLFIPTASPAAFVLEYLDLLICSSYLLVSAVSEYFLILKK